MEKQKNKWNTKDIISMTGIIATLFTTLITGHLVYVQNKEIEYIKSNLERENLQYRTSNEIFANFVRSYNENYPFLNELADKYGTSTEVLKQKMTPEERIRYNNRIAEFNIILSHLYVTLPDDSYAILLKEWKDGRIRYQDLVNQLLVSMRQINYPDTEYKTVKDIKTLHY